MGFSSDAILPVGWGKKKRSKSNKFMEYLDCSWLGSEKGIGKTQLQTKMRNPQSFSKLFFKRNSTTVVFSSPSFKPFWCWVVLFGSVKAWCCCSAGFDVCSCMFLLFAKFLSWLWKCFAWCTCGNIRHVSHFNFRRSLRIFEQAFVCSDTQNYNLLRYRYSSIYQNCSALHAES